MALLYGIYSVYSRSSHRAGMVDPLGCKASRCSFICSTNCICVATIRTMSQPFTVVVGGQRFLRTQPFQNPFLVCFHLCLVKTHIRRRWKSLQVILFSFMTQCRQIQILGHLIQNMLMSHVNVCVNGEYIYVMKRRRLLKYFHHNATNKQIRKRTTLKTKLWIV